MSVLLAFLYGSGVCKNFLFKYLSANIYLVVSTCLGIEYNHILHDIYHRTSVIILLIADVHVMES